MQVTGSNIEQQDNVLSIRLSPNGQYFSEPQPAAEPTVVKVWLDTIKVVLVPTESFSDDLAESYLKINGHQIADNESVVISEPVGNLLAIISFDRKAIDDLKAQHGNKVQFYSMLHPSLERARENSIEITRHDNRLYLTLYNKVLEYAESLPYSSIADLLYYIENLKSTFGLDKREIYVYGDESKQISALLKRYYKRVHEQTI